MRSSPTRSSLSRQDSIRISDDPGSVTVKPCRACARSPTMVKLREGQRSNNICHSASVNSCASSTTMWANGPAWGSLESSCRSVSSTKACLRSWPRNIDITRSSESSDAMRSSTTPDRRSCSARRAARRRRMREAASGSPSRCRAASRRGRSETVHARGSGRCSAATSSESSQGAHMRR